ncbi:hypothetical protein ETB97_008720 [Aspergillus alliaceus]|uniref:Uncharacterized protein n=1 Tax=Petromyces alliaceus TaxID=209559 RepID=A0A8H6AH93_PETAA|nr:hypothetical protein ETB97_008720 [Aspergillus burnettii]
MDLNRGSSSGTPIGPPPIAGFERNSAPTTNDHVPAWAMKDAVQGATTTGTPGTTTPRMDVPVNPVPNEAPTAPERRPRPRLPDPEIFDEKNRAL